MKKLILFILILLIALTGCRENNPDGFQEDSGGITKVAQLNESGRKIGVPTGSKADYVVQEQFTNAEIVQYKSVGEGFIAVKTGKIDAFCFTKNEMMYTINQNPDLCLLEEVIAENDLAIGARLGENDLIAQVNNVITQFNENGLYDEMFARWLGDNENPVMPFMEAAKNPTRNIVIGTSDENRPTSYLDGESNPIGFDVEYAMRLAKELNMEIEIKSMEWASLIPSLQSGKIDLIIANLNVTEERKQSILFSDVYMTSDIVMMVRKTEDAAIVQNPPPYRAEDFAGKKMSVPSGSIFDQIILEHIPDAEPVYYQSNNDAIAAIKSGKIDALVEDDASLRVLASKTPGLTLLEPFITQDDYGVATSKDNTELLERLNEFIALIKSDGTYDDMLKRWLHTGTTPSMPDIAEGNNGTLKFGTSGITEGFSYYSNGEICGFDVEIAKRFAAHLNRKLEILVMDFGGIIPAVQSGKVDFAANFFTITEERKKSVSFSDPYYSGGVAVCVYDVHSDSLDASFWQNVKTSFQRNLITENRWKMIVEGLLVSMVITIFAFVLATLLGFGVCGLRMSTNRILNAIGSIYVTILRGTPIVVLLMIAFYVIFAESDISGTLVAILAFGTNGAAFIGEIIRSAILTVDKGQVEAARSMGFGKAGAFFTVTFPQAVRVAFPVYKSEFISLFKMTSVVGYIAIIDLTKAGDIIRSRTYDAFFPLIIVALVYLLASSIMVFLFDLANRFTDKRVRSCRKIS